MLSRYFHNQRTTKCSCHSDLKFHALYLRSSFTKVQHHSDLEFDCFWVTMENGVAFWVLIFLKWCMRLVDFFLSYFFKFTLEFGPNCEAEKAETNYETSAQVVRVVARATYHTIITITPRNFLYVHDK